MFLSIKNIEFKTIFFLLKHIFSCKIFAAKFQSIFDNFCNNLRTAKNSLHDAARVQYLKTNYKLGYYCFKFTRASLYFKCFF